jgi:hypothetical protein
VCNLSVHSLSVMVHRFVTMSRNASFSQEPDGDAVTDVSLQLAHVPHGSSWHNSACNV